MEKLRKRVNKLLKKEGKSQSLRDGGEYNPEKNERELVKKMRKQLGGKKKKKGKRRGNPKALKPWREHVAKIKKKLPKGTPYKEVLILASETWTKKSGGKKNKKKKYKKKTLERLIPKQDDFVEEKMTKIYKKQSGGKKKDLKSKLYAIKGMISAVIDNM